MDIEIFGTESLGVRGLSCKIESGNRTILIDPGIALGYHRHGLLPHPFQVAVGIKIRERITAALTEATDVVISHYHGDHIPLFDANPYQLGIEQVTGLRHGARFWSNDISALTPRMKERATALRAALNRDLRNAEGTCDGNMCFSIPVPHGEADSTHGEVMMTRIEDEEQVFVHASDIQLLNRESINQILQWRPDIVLASGPPLYLKRLSADQQEYAWENALRLSCEIDTVILDHHLMRCTEGIAWLKSVSRETGNRVVCAADFLRRPRLLLEAQRRRLYSEMPVPEGWHMDYARGMVTVDGYRVWRGHEA
jgi:predicted metallo-beta-lactamase superfamily hydrolase